MPRPRIERHAGVSEAGRRPFKGIDNIGAVLDGGAPFEELHLKGDAVLPLDAGGLLPQKGGHGVKAVLLKGAEIHRKDRAGGHRVDCTGLQLHLAAVYGDSAAVIGCNLILKAREQADRRQPGVAAFGVRNRRMARPAACGQPEPCVSADGAHHPDIGVRGLEPGCLLHMQFEKGFGFLRAAADPFNTARQTVFPHRVDQQNPVVIGQTVQIRLAVDSHHEPAAGGAGIAPAVLHNGSNHLEVAFHRNAALHQHPRSLKRADDSRRPVKGPGAAHRIEVGAGHNLRRGGVAALHHPVKWSLQREKIFPVPFPPLPDFAVRYSAILFR